MIIIKHLIVTLLMMPLLSCFANSKNIIPEQIINKIHADFPSEEIAQKNDFLPYLQGLVSKYPDKYLSVASYDLTGNNQKDYVFILINREKRYFQFVAFISNNKYSMPLVLSKSHWPNEHDNKIWQIMWLKKKGEYGLAKEKYFNAPMKDYPYLKAHTPNDVMEYESAIERYKAMPVIEKSDCDYGSFDPEDLFYCKSSYYYEDGEFKKLNRCD